jgi:hypothetical protein
VTRLVGKTQGVERDPNPIYKLDSARAPMNEDSTKGYFVFNSKLNKNREKSLKRSDTILKLRKNQSTFRRNGGAIVNSKSLSSLIEKSKNNSFQKSITPMLMLENANSDLDYGESLARNDKGSFGVTAFSDNDKNEYAEDSKEKSVFISQCSDFESNLNQNSNENVFVTDIQTNLNTNHNVSLVSKALNSKLTSKRETNKDGVKFVTAESYERMHQYSYP